MTCWPYLENVAGHWMLDASIHLLPAVKLESFLLHSNAFFTSSCCLFLLIINTGFCSSMHLL